LFRALGGGWQFAHTAIADADQPARSR